MNRMKTNNRNDKNVYYAEGICIIYIFVISGLLVCILFIIIIIAIF